MRWPRIRIPSIRSRILVRPTVLRMDELDPRIVPAVTASFAGGVLTVNGDALDNTITISRTVAGQILVNGGTVPVTGGTPTIANTNNLRAFGLVGNDRLALNPANGPLPVAELTGGAGNDTLTGGSGPDVLFGEAGDDFLFGKGGSDFLFGGNDQDILFGGDGSDEVQGEFGNDRLIWKSGDDTDLNEGGDGIDTIEVNGSSAAENFTATANGLRVRFDRLGVQAFSLDIGTAENLVVHAGGGNDQFSATGNLAALIAIAVNGDDGDDRLLGSNGIDRLTGGNGSDFVDGQQGSDAVFLGAGNDRFQWDPGDGSDVVEGQGGIDRLLFNGSGGNEIIAISANGQRVLLSRDLGLVSLDLNDLETIELNALSGADRITLNDLSGTDLTRVNLNLAGTLGGSIGDTVADSVIVNGTDSNDVVTVAGAGNQTTVTGLPVTVRVKGLDGRPDVLSVNTRGGHDRIQASALPGSVVSLLTDGGSGNDTLIGGSGSDFFLGGEGNDFADGNGGNDTLLLGFGDDAAIWNPGDGSDVVEGQDGFDTLKFTGSGTDEHFEMFANGGRVGLVRNIDTVSMDLNGLEVMNVQSAGGSDLVTMGDLTGANVGRINLNLSLPGGIPDQKNDQVVVDGTNGNDTMVVSGTPAAITVTGTAAFVNIVGMETAHDRLTINALGGEDTVNASASSVGIDLVGGLGNDILIGSSGHDFVNGGDGNDTALMNDGNDSFFWNPGDDNDVVEGQGGSDRLQFNGANVSENVTISANGGRVVMFRDIAAVTMDLDGTETIAFNALGGADRITVNDLSGTDLTRVTLNLASTVTGTTGDFQPDTVVVNGTNGNDAIQVQSSAGAVEVLGLAARVTITGSESANDRLEINSLGGNDRVQASLLAAGRLIYSASGADGNDTLIGSAGNDVLIGGIGNDRLVGGPGLDDLNAAPGNDVVIQ